jgi:iron(III) transport system ATP-binding protein
VRDILKARGTSAILVTHDQEEAFSLSDRVGVLNNGALEQDGTPAEIYHHPRSRFVADFVGKADFIDGEIEGKTVRSVFGTFPFDGSPTQETGQMELMVRPDDVAFSLDSTGEATIIEARFLGASILYLLRLGNGKTIHAIRPSTEMFPVGARVRVKLDARHIVIFPKQ